ncbi:amylo-alpha-1,6-glucosidase [Blautia sp.]|mgnify:FL=1|uniref:amylo-alpha-1,6-glucosidase n=1 Tax=Blautia sp. TaxID=1955243 RepID=UPI002E784E9A|nr:trehalase family glycosidase [Blautia sp.]MEE0809489.1 trehalase family glycosidase [Blautia sp.]
MKFNLEEIPFSTRGSYMVFSKLGKKFQGEEIQEGIYFRNVHGSAVSSLVARIVPQKNGQEIPYQYEASPQEVKIYDDEHCCRITWQDEKTVLLEGDLPFYFDFLAEGSSYTFAQPWKVGNRDFYLVNCFRGNSRYMIRSQKGSLQLKQKWREGNAEYSYLYVNGDAPYMLVLEENFEDWKDRGEDYDYTYAAQKQKQKFEEFYALMPSVPDKYQDAAEISAYVDWTGMVSPCGLLKREAMFMSKNWMCNVWSWDHCFNALALAYHCPKEAWDQFMVLFDFQKESGNIPDSVNDTKVIHNYCKPPIHGWTLRKLMKVMDLSVEQLKEAYEKLGRWTSWWLNYRDENGDGLCEYSHGNDSGWDNATAFDHLPPVTLPDLAAFLVLQMDVLSEVAEKLNEQADAKMWKNRANEMLNNMLDVLFENGQPVARAGFDMHKVENESLILYLPIVLGKRLPEGTRKELIQTLESDKFQTSYGLATESWHSKEYESDGYWRGPIWAPSTMLILDGLKECGEDTFVKDMTEKFCQLVQKSGCAENFNALTGEGLRDRAYTWTASVMLVMAHEYL